MGPSVSVTGTVSETGKMYNFSEKVSVEEMGAVHYQTVSSKAELIYYRNHLRTSGSRVTLQVWVLWRSVRRKEAQKMVCPVQPWS